MLKPSKLRLTFIDVARTCAVILALLSHLFIAIGFYQRIGPDAILVKQFTRMATPLFVFMFGFMIEYVYVRGAQANGLSLIYQRILIRSFQCYMAYAVVSFCSTLGGYKSASDFLGSLLFFSDSKFGNILRAYSIMLLITPFLIQLRIKLGVKFLFASLILLIVSYAFLDRFYSIDLWPFNHQLSILFGIGPHRGGPSVYGALSFLLAGMLMASSLSAEQTERSNSLSKFYLVSLVLTLTCLVLGSIFIQESLLEARVLFSDFTYRKNNAPGYYIIGIIGSVFIITLLCFLIGTRTMPNAVKFILPLGTSSLISYTTGNIFLSLFGTRLGSIDLALLIPLFFLFVILVTKVIGSLKYPDDIDKLLNLKDR